MAAIPEMEITVSFPEIVTESYILAVLDDEIAKTNLGIQPGMAVSESISSLIMFA